MEDSKLLATGTTTCLQNRVDAVSFGREAARCSRFCNTTSADSPTPGDQNSDSHADSPLLGGRHTINLSTYTGAMRQCVTQPRMRHGPTLPKASSWAPTPPRPPQLHQSHAARPAALPSPRQPTVATYERNPVTISAQRESPNRGGFGG
jgi:hypothetical protein